MAKTAQPMKGPPTPMLSHIAEPRPRATSRAERRAYWGGVHVRYGSLADITSGSGMSALPSRADIRQVSVNVR